MTKPIAVKFKNVSFSYKNENEGNPTINNISFEIEQGEYVCIVGGNGSGKSTISKLIVGLLKPHSGSIFINDKILNTNNLTFVRENVGIIFQNPDNQFIGLTSENDIAFGLENKQIDASYMREIIKVVAKIVNIEDLLKKDASKLSGGQKQKVAIASILATNPKVIIFDESTSMLDPTSKIELKKLILFLKSKLNKTIISITHDVEEIINADKVMVINNGSIEKYDKPETIFNDENFLRKNKLDAPYVVQLSRQLNKTIGINVTLNQAEMIKNICKYEKNK